jgi:hypothetical protein
MISLPNSRDLEPFLQTWLFFGLLSETFCGNAVENTEIIPRPVDEEPNVRNCNEIVRRIYERSTYQSGDNHYVTTATFLQDFEHHVKLSMVDRARFRAYCVRLGHCLQVAWKVLKAVPKDFDPVIRASIGVVAELLSHSMNYAFTKHGIPPHCPNKWTTTYFDQEPVRQDGLPSVRATMLSKGWCPSDISRSMNKFNSLQLFHFLGTMDRSIPFRNHSQCNDVHCAAYQINKDYEVRHVQPKVDSSDLSPQTVRPKCGCRLMYVDSLAIISILEKNDTIPLLKFVGGIDDLTIEVVPSSKHTPYVAISHVSHQSIMQSILNLNL